jgi:peptide/nickel transport system substrate-binding protein
MESCSENPTKGGKMKKHICVTILMVTAFFLISLSSSVLSAETPKRGGTVVVALGAEPMLINPGVTTNDPDVYTGCMVYEGLVRINNKFDVEPALAKSWKISDDGLTYTFSLQDAKWSDGKPVTSDDVKFSLEEVGGKLGSRFAAAAKSIESIETPDAKTVQIKLHQPFGPMLFSLACDNNAGILPAHIFKGQDILKNPANSTIPAANGPFLLQKWVRGDHLVFIRNPNYWRAGQPYLDRVIIKVMTDSAARIMALQGEEIDHIHQYFFPLSSFDTFAKDKRFSMVEGNFPSLDLAILNLKQPPLDNLKVRHALLMAVDRDYLCKAVFFGTGQPGQGAFDTRIPWSYNQAIKYDQLYPYNPDKAKAMLDEAGFKLDSNGIRFKLRLIFDTARPELIAWAQTLRQQWRAVGIDMELNGAERPVVLNKVYTDYDFDITLQNYTTAGDPALGIARSYTSDSIQKGRSFNNASQYSNPRVDELFEKGRTASSTSDRAKAYFEAQEILARDLPVLVLHQRASIHASIAALKGFSNGGGYPWWGEAWLDK